MKKPMQKPHMAALRRAAVARARERLANKKLPVNPVIAVKPAVVDQDTDNK